MIKPLLAQYHFSKALGAWKKDDWAGCLRHLQRAESSKQFGPFRAAFKAQVLTALREYEAADQLFSLTLAALEGPRNARDRYIQIVCLLWQENSFRDLPEANSLWAEAMGLKCSPAVKRFLLLRQPPEFALPSSNVR